MTCLKIQVPLPEKYVRTGPAHFVDANKRLVLRLLDFGVILSLKKKSKKTISRLDNRVPMRYNRGRLALNTHECQQNSLKS